jgi:hypothetical protein
MEVTGKFAGKPKVGWRGRFPPTIFRKYPESEPGTDPHV